MSAAGGKRRPGTLTPTARMPVSDASGGDVLRLVNRCLQDHAMEVRRVIKEILRDQAARHTQVGVIAPDRADPGHRGGRTGQDND